MRPNFYVAVTVLLSACGGAGAVGEGDVTTRDKAPGTAGNTGAGGQRSGADDGGMSGELGPPVQIATGQATLVGTTQDGWAVFRNADSLSAASIGEQSEVQQITEKPGSVLIRGNVVFNWADVNWELGVGDLSIWTAAAGSQSIGLTPYSEAHVAASEDGSTIVYTTPVEGETTKLMIAPSDLSSPEVLIEAMGIGSEATCGAKIGFVGQRLFVGWCELGSRAATIQRFERVGAAWEPSVIAEDALPSWSADSAGERVFYQSSGYNGFVSDSGSPLSIDAGVGQGVMLPDGSAVFYTVGDQLRRATLPSVNPTPIVTTGYKQPIGFSPSYDLALYSTTVTYEQGTQRDLFLVNTDKFNDTPIALVTTPVATLARSSMTQDGQFIFYMTDMTETGGSLHVISRDGTELVVLPNVAEAAAGKGSTIVFADNSSDPEQYPIVADLKVIDLSTETEPQMIEEMVLNGKSFQLDADRGKAVFVRSGVDRDAEAADSQGVFFRTLY